MVDQHSGGQGGRRIPRYHVDAVGNIAFKPFDWHGQVRRYTNAESAAVATAGITSLVM